MSVRVSWSYDDILVHKWLPNTQYLKKFDLSYLGVSFITKKQAYDPSPFPIIRVSEFEVIMDATYPQGTFH